MNEDDWYTESSESLLNEVECAEQHMFEDYDRFMRFVACYEVDGEDTYYDQD